MFCVNLSLKVVYFELFFKLFLIIVILNHMRKIKGQKTT